MSLSISSAHGLETPLEVKKKSFSAAFFPQDVFFCNVASLQGGKCSDFPDSQLLLLYGFQNTSMNIISFHPHRHIYLDLEKL